MPWSWHATPPTERSPLAFDVTGFAPGFGQDDGLVPASAASRELLARKSSLRGRRRSTGSEAAFETGAATGVSERPLRPASADAIEAAIRNHETAFHMQAAVPALTDLSGETEATKRLYGLDAKDPKQAAYGRQCLLARRLVERGVRFVQLYSGGAHNDDNWDAHGDLVKNHEFHAGNTDKPIAALLSDLKRTGLLDETLVIWGGEFGRQPTAEYAEGTGRDQNAFGFTMWMAGGGIKGGVSVGETDELGAAAITLVHDGTAGYHVKSLHAALLPPRWAGGAPCQC